MNNLINKKALIGHTGFVGTTLKKQYKFDSFFRSNNIHTIKGKEFDLVVCAGAQAKKWLANQNPKKDKESIETLMDALHYVNCKKIILISTVDVFANSIGVNEKTDINLNELNPYGLHRRELEVFIKTYFQNYLIIRLPGLVGPGLKKNIIFDLHNNNNLSKVDCRGIFQFYPMVNLWYDIQIANHIGKNIVHLTAEPLSVSEISEKAFGFKFDNVIDNNYSKYDFQTIYSDKMGGTGNYNYSKKQSLQAIRSYVQTEKKQA